MIPVHYNILIRIFRLPFEYVGFLKSIAKLRAHLPYLDNVAGGNFVRNLASSQELDVISVFIHSCNLK